MKSCLRHVLAIAVVCGLCLCSVSVLAQNMPVHSPIGPPISPLTYAPSVPNGPLPAPRTPMATAYFAVGQSYDGIDFLGSNCGCLPPDTNAAVNASYVVETVNIQVRIFSKATGAVLLDEPLSTLFGAATGGDPYVVYDDLVNRWYITGFDGTDAGLYLAVSNDSSPLDGFAVYHLANVGGFPDYNKVGYNKNAIFISYNNFGPGASGYAQIAAIDKTQILAGNLVYYVSNPANQFRAMPPAQMHGDTLGGIEWFVSTDGTDAGGTTIRVTKMTNYLSNSPVFTYTSLPVTQYQQATTADQPGGAGSVTVFPNTTFTQVHFRKNHLLAAMSSGQAQDGFVYPKGLFFKIKASRTLPPALLKQVTINPGLGVAVQMASMDEDSTLARNLGFNWIESSSTEYLSMWVGTLKHRAVVAPGGGFFTYGFRLGDYSSLTVDPSDGVTFWGANEYIGSNGGSDIWLTHIASFTAP